jgi:uncharacterized membrane protein YfcA
VPDPLLQLGLFVAALVANLLSALAGGGAGLVQLPVLILLGLPFPVALATHKVASVALGLGARGQIAWDWLPMLLLGSLAGGYLGAHLTIARGSRLVKRAFELLALLMGTSLLLRSL